MINFLPLTLDYYEKYNKYWHLCSQHSMDYTFVNLWGWQEYSDLYCYFDEHLFWIKPNSFRNDIVNNISSVPIFWAPIGDWNAVQWQKEKNFNFGAILHRVPEKLAFLLEKNLSNRVKIEEDRNQFEYIYSKNELATLPGNRFHKKRNHVNKFKKIYEDIRYQNFNNVVIEDVLLLQDEWCKWHECANSPSLLAENFAINKVLSHWQHFPNLRGGALYVKENLVAFSVGEKLKDNVLGVHFEKGHSAYKGVYQAMNTCFVQKAGNDCIVVNREQDLGEEGLRHAKMSYLPIDFLRKYTVTIQPA